MSRPSFILPPGSVLGGYEIEDVVGVGGMAVVYRALQVSLNRRVALKVLNPRLAADSTFRERFRREGALVATLDHPGVIPVYDSGETDGRLFLAMRLVDGETLAEHMAEGLPIAEALPMLSAVAGALDAAHEAGLLHRDVKPQNILISHAGHVYLADFGVAKGAGVSNLTATQGFLGSVNYVAPEQIRGNAVGPQADVYALAVVAYECLTGRTPFARDTEAAVIHAHLSDDPPVLSPAGDRWSAAVGAALAAGLEKDPTKRAATAGAFMLGLERALSGAPAELLTRVPGFPPAETADESRSQSAAGAAAGVDGPPHSIGHARVVPGAAAGLAVGQATEPPAPLHEPVAATPEPVEVRPTEHTVHDRRRSEFLPEAPKRTSADRFYSRAPWAVLAIAVAVPVAVAAITGDKPVPRVSLGPATTVPVEHWTSKAVKRPATTATAGLVYGDRTVAFTSPDGKSTVLAGVLASTSGLSPKSLGKGEKVSQVSVTGGTARQWQAPISGGVLRISLTSTQDGEVAMVCRGAAASVGPACDELLGALRADHGTLVADPTSAVATPVAAALKGVTAARKVTLPTKDRTRRARDAGRIASAYRAASARIAALGKQRPWDRDVARLAKGLASGQRAFISFRNAAQDKDTSRDARARGVLAAADASIDTALSRLTRRGYAVKGLKH